MVYRKLTTLILLRMENVLHRHAFPCGPMRPPISVDDRQRQLINDVLIPAADGVRRV